MEYLNLNLLRTLNRMKVGDICVSLRHGYDVQRTNGGYTLSGPMRGYYEGLTSEEAVRIMEIHY